MLDVRGLLTVSTWLPAVDEKLPVGELARAGRLCDADALGDARAERHVMHTRGVALHDQLTGGREPRVSNARGDDGRAGHGRPLHPGAATGVTSPVHASSW